MVVWRQVKKETNSLLIAVRVSKTHVLKLPDVMGTRRARDFTYLQSPSCAIVVHVFLCNAEGVSTGDE